MIGRRLIFFDKPLQRSNLCASHRQRRWLTHGELWRHLRILIDRQDYWSFDGMRSNTISNGRDSTAQWIDTAGFWSRTKTSSKDEHPQLTYHKYLYGLAVRQASLGRGARSNRPPPAGAACAYCAR